MSVSLLSITLVRNGQRLTLLASSPGKGALVRLGDFWYPARLLQREHDQTQDTWKVRLWRLCTYPQGLDAPKSLDITVPQADIVDELWDNKKARRGIRVRNALP